MTARDNSRSWTDASHSLDAARRRHPPEKLVDRLRANDREALSSIYDAHSGSAYALAFRLLRSADDAQTVVRESFLELWHNAANLDESLGIRSTLLGIVSRRSAETLRVRAGHEKGAAASPPAAEVDGLDGAVDPPMFDESAFRKAFASLPADQQQVLQSTFFARHTVNEAALELGVSAEVLKQRLRAALQALGSEGCS